MNEITLDGGYRVDAIRGTFPDGRKLTIFPDGEVTVVDGEHGLNEYRFQLPESADVARKCDTEGRDGTVLFEVHHRH